MPTVLFGTEYWNSVFNLQSMVDWGTISPDDIHLMHVTDSIEDAFNFITKGLIESEDI